MKFSLRLSFLFGTVFLCALLPACQKTSNCPDAAPVLFHQNGPVVAGWPLYLECNLSSTAYLYKWSGPNGWEQQYETFASDAYSQMREHMTAADAGEYKLKLVNIEGCVEYEGSVMVEVIDAPRRPALFLPIPARLL